MYKRQVYGSQWMSCDTKDRKSTRCRLAWKDSNLFIIAHKPINKYRPTPIIGKIRIKMTQGIFIEDVLFDAYNPKTKIPLKILSLIHISILFSFPNKILKIVTNKKQNAIVTAIFTKSVSYTHLQAGTGDRP